MSAAQSPDSTALVPCGQIVSASLRRASLLTVGLDYQFDQTMDGMTLNFPNVIDNYSRLALAIRVGKRTGSLW